jgi:hypothetical protein
VHILDPVFGRNNFRNEFTWQRTNAHNDARKKMPNLSDTVFYYTKSEKYTYNTIFGQLDDKYIKDFYRNQDEKGIYMSGDLTGPKISKGESGAEWRGYNPSKSGRSWAVPNIIVEELVGKEKTEQMGIIDKLELLYQNNCIIFTNKGTPRVKRYIENSSGMDKVKIKVKNKKK